MSPVVVSGALDDGTSGLWGIKRFGGIAMVQEPSQALIDGMPQSVLEYVEVDQVLPSTEIGAVLGRLSQEPPEPRGIEEEVLTTRMAAEAQITLGNSAFQEGIMELGTPTPFTYPECHGVLMRLSEGLLSRFRCHTGHAYTDSALLSAVMEATGDLVWQVIRSFEEAVMLLTHMGQHKQAAGALAQAEAFFAKARELEQRARRFRRTVLHHESLSGDHLGRLPEEDLQRTRLQPSCRYRNWPRMSICRSMSRRSSRHCDAVKVCPCWSARSTMR